MDDSDIDVQDVLLKLNFRKVYHYEKPGRDHMFQVTGKMEDLLQAQALVAELTPDINFTIAPSSRPSDPANFRFSTIVGWLSGTTAQLMPYALLLGKRLDLSRISA